MITTPTRRELRNPRKDFTALELQNFLTICEKQARRRMGAFSAHVDAAIDAAIENAVESAMAREPNNYIAQKAKQGVLHFKRTLLGRYKFHDRSERRATRANIACPLLVSDMIDCVEWDHRDVSASSEASFRQVEETIFIEAALGRIPAREAGVVRRHIVDGESFAAISRDMKIHESRAYQLYARGLDRMRQFIEV